MLKLCCGRVVVGPIWRSIRQVSCQGIWGCHDESEQCWDSLCPKCTPVLLDTTSLLPSCCWLDRVES